MDAMEAAQAVMTSNADLNKSKLKAPTANTNKSKPGFVLDLRDTDPGVVDLRDSQLGTGVLDLRDTEPGMVDLRDTEPGDSRKSLTNNFKPEPEKIAT